MGKERILFKLKRLNKGLSQYGLADDLYKKTGLDITGAFIGQLERGERNPRLDSAKILADYFNTSVEKLFN